MCVLFKGKATVNFGGGAGADPGFGNEFVRGLGAKSPKKLDWTFSANCYNDAF